MDEHRWYAIQTTAGHENKVRSLIQRKIDWSHGASNGMAVTIRAGMSSTDVAKITGITPDTFTFSGM